jgi:hypothetical protein
VDKDVVPPLAEICGDDGVEAMFCGLAEVKAFFRGKPAARATADPAMRNFRRDITIG